VIAIGGASIQVIDAHVHVFPEEVGQRRAEWLLRDRWFQELYENPRSHLATVEDLIASMDASGVDQAILCGFPWSDDAHCRFHNEYMADAAARNPDRLAWLGIVSPRDKGDSTAEACFASGAVGLGELNADAQGFSWTDSRAFEHVARIAEANDKPVLIHSSEPIGHLYPGKGKATPDQILSLADAFPALKIVAAHWGGGLPFFELMPEVRRSLTNLAYDSAATTYLYDQSIFEHAMRICGTDKVVFASDYPVLRQERLVERMRSLAWSSQEDAGKVLGGNARRIYFGVATS
jgi:predicted TIM-barrel fold metal-dependent hydrolase